MSGPPAAQVEARLADLEALDERSRATALAAVQAIVDLYGAGLERIVEHVAVADDGRLAEAFADDEVVAHLLFLHELHPVPVEERVARALDEVRPYLRSHGGDVELLGVADGVAHVRLEGSCDGCPSSAMTLKLAIEDAIHQAAPDVARVEAAGVAPPAQALIPLTAVRRGPRREEDDAAWSVAGVLPQLASGGTLRKDVAGEALLFMRLGADTVAYRAACPGCGDSLETAVLSGSELACPECGQRYDVRRAGRCLDAPDRFLEPVPLLVSADGIVKVALTSKVP